MPDHTADANLSPRRRIAHVLTHSMEDYIKAIYKIQQEQERATTIRIAERLGFSAASVTNMLQKLARLDLVRYQPYQGAELTELGERIALEIIRHHRLIELYLAEHVGYGWDEVDAEAEELEHVISEDFEDRIDALLGHPDTDPHGAPIPTKEGHIANARRYRPLASVEAGESVVVRRVSDREPTTLRRLGEIGLYPDVHVRVLGHDIENASLRIEIDSEEYDLATEHASRVYVDSITETR